jgi:hypothetical protein
MYSDKKHNRCTDPFGLPYLAYEDWKGDGEYYFIRYFRERNKFEYIEELQRPNVFLILHDLLEGYAYRRFPKIDRFVCENNLQHKVIFATSLYNAENEYEKWTDNPNFKTVYYPEWYHRVYDNLIDYNLHKIKYDRANYFCCLNNRPHPHRLQTVTYMDYLGLLDRGTVTCLDKQYETYEAVPTMYDSIVMSYKNFTEETFDIINEQKEITKHKLPLNFDTEDFSRGSRPHDYNRLVYQDSLINVVTETHYEPHWNVHEHIFLSEKTWKPIVCKQAFIIVGPMHTLKYLKQLGFKTFDHIWDETYDDCNQEKRLYKAVESLYNTLSKYSLEELQHATLDVRKHNFEHFKSIKESMTYVGRLR